MKTFLVTGATGFLGSELVEALLSEGHGVIGIGRQPRGFLRDKVLSDRGFTLLNLDMSKSFSGALGDMKLNGVFHLGARQPGPGDLRYDDFHRGNVLPALNLIEAIEGMSLEFLCYASTTSVVGGEAGGAIITEASPVCPDGYYAITKHVAERLFANYGRASATKVVVVRFPSIIGKNHLGGIAYTLFCDASSGRDIVLFSGGGRKRSLIHSVDATGALLKIPHCLDKLDKFEVICASSADARSTHEIAMKLRTLLNSASNIILDDQPGGGHDVVVGISKAREKLGLDPMTVERGLERYVREMR